MTHRDDVGPIDLFCEAPPYGVVIASGANAVGIRKPEDVPWVKAKSRSCDRCKCRLRFARFDFTWSHGTVNRIKLAQCDLCDKVFWAEEVER